MSKTVSLVKNTVEVVGVSQLITTTVTNSFDGLRVRIIRKLSSELLDCFYRIPNLSYAQAKYVAPYGVSALFVVATRVWDAVGDRLFLPSDNEQTTWRNLLSKEVFSAGMTVLTGAAAGAIFLAATGPVTVSAVVSVAALAAIVWMTTKMGDVAFYALKEIAINLKKGSSQTQPETKTTIITISDYKMLNPKEIKEEGWKLLKKMKEEESLKKNHIEQGPLPKQTDDNTDKKNKLNQNNKNKTLTNKHPKIHVPGRVEKVNPSIQPYTSNSIN